MKISFEQKMDDLVAFEKEFINMSPLHQRAIKKLKTTYPIIVIALFLVISFLLFSIEILPIFFLFGLGLAMYYNYLGRSYYDRIHKSTMRDFDLISNSASTYHKKISAKRNTKLVEMCFEEKHLKINADGLESCTEYWRFLKLSSTRDYYFIYLTPFSALIIPKYRLDSNIDLNAFDALIKSKLDFNEKD